MTHPSFNFFSGKSDATISTLNFLSSIENTGQSSCSAQQDNTAAVESLPQYASVVPEKEAMESTKSFQMTIFYGGKVLVYDDLPADKAREVMQLAGSGCSSSGDLQVVKIDKTLSSADPLPSNSMAPPPPPAPPPQPVHVCTQERPQPRAEANTSGN